MLVVRADRDAEPVLVVPRLEAPRVVAQPDAFSIRPWDETDDPIAVVADLARGARTAAIGDQTWARFVLALQAALPARHVRTRAIDVTGPLRVVKDAAEVDALRAAAVAVDAIAVGHARAARSPVAARSTCTASWSSACSTRVTERANFAIVATGANAASPHHDPSTRVIERGDLVLCDFGGTMDGYCSDITRMYSVGEPTAEVRDAYAVLVEAQEAGVRAATVGTPCEDVDAAARRVIADGGYGDALRAPHRARHRRRGARGPVRGVGQRHAARARPRVQRRARHLPRRAVRHAARGHRGGDRRRARAPEPGTARPRRRRLRSGPPMTFDLATLLVQLAAGGLFFCWITTRRREVGLGYGWLLRIVFGVLAALGVVAGLGQSGTGATIRNVAAALDGGGGDGRARAVGLPAHRQACAATVRSRPGAPRRSRR